MLNLPPIDFKNKQVQIVILVILVFLISFILYLTFILKPQVARVFDVIGKGNKTALDLRNAEADVSRIDKFKKDMASYQDKVNRYEKMLPAEQEIPNFLEELSNMARSSNLKIVGITPIPAKEKTSANKIYQGFPILISAKSGYHEIGRFLSSLENANRFLKVADIEIKTDPATPKKHSVELLILTYILLKDK